MGVLKKIRNLKAKANEPKPPVSDESNRIEQLRSISKRVDTVADGHVFHLEKGTSLRDLQPVIGNVPWAAATDAGYYMIALPAPIAMATMLMTVGHDDSICAEINSLMESVSKVREVMHDDSSFSRIVDECVKVYEVSGHDGNGIGSFSLKDDEEISLESMVYGAMTRKQVVEFALSVANMARTRPDFQNAGLNGLFNATERYWSELLDQIGPVGVMETLSNYQGKA